MFQPGIRGNTRGRPRGSVSGRAQALATLDRMLSEECNQQVLFDALEKEFQADPARFFRNTVVPLIPRSMREAPPPDANDDWLPLERHPPSTPPPCPGPYSPPVPTPPPLPPPPGMESSSGNPDLQPSVLRPQPSVLSSLLSFACYSLLLIPSSVHPLPHLIHSRTLELPIPFYSQTRIHFKRSNTQTLKRFTRLKLSPRPSLSSPNFVIVSGFVKC